jgi:tRNA-splicing ligase RtcB (3'-phosphate/5'-hydroxy nucleic acid ligase)
MKARQLEQLGIPKPLAQMAKWTAQAARKAGVDRSAAQETLRRLAQNPDAYRDDEHFGELARQVSLIKKTEAAAGARYVPRETPAPYRQWGDELDPKSVQQMHTACWLNVAARGALMPDAHVGYGLPIGGVLAARNAVIPYAVGVDIACRVKLTVLDMPAKALQSQADRLTGALENETRFGIGSQFKGRLREHTVLDEDWDFSPVTKRNRDKAAVQLGTSGSGNHFVEFGVLKPGEGADELGLEPGREYLALLSHSGSRGTGAAVCSHYSQIAMALHPELDKVSRHLAWLDMDSHEGQEYWHAMELMGRYASANHACIHKAIIKHLGARALATVENHHNFAWRERHEVDGEQIDVIVHRKGATPAGSGVLGIIPGSMASACYVVRGKGSADAMNSAAHGAGRVMSRTQAKNTYRWANIRPMLEKAGVTLLSAGIDEAPVVYKNIDKVMALQSDLVEPIARFDPKLVKMAPAGERPED